jgi:hypothetical protein
MQMVDVAEYNHAGDPDVLRQIIRLKLAAEPNGWRGSAGASCVTRHAVARGARWMNVLLPTRR